MEDKICLRCGKKIPFEIKKCECEGKRFIYSDEMDLKKEEDTFICECGGDTFSPVLFLDYAEKGVNTYKCNTCAKQVTLEEFRDDDSVMNCDTK